MGKLLGGRYYYGLDLGSEPAVSVRDCALILEIKHVAHASYDMVYTHLAAHVDRETIIVDYADTFDPIDGLAYDVHPLFSIEEATLVLVDADGDDNPVEHRQRPLENVEMAGGERVERSGEKCYSIQFIGDLCSDSSMAFALEKWRQPKNAPLARGEGCAASSTVWREVSMRGALLRA